jgi:hypothetical protein
MPQALQLVYFSFGFTGALIGTSFGVNDYLNYLSILIILID